MSTIAWFEVPAGETGRAKQFYGQLFDWQFQPFEEGGDYHVSLDAGGAISPADEQGILVYFASDEIDASVARVRELGGKAGDAQEIPGVGRYSHCTDTEGNPFGLYQRAG
jgi:uncharacterized protein